MNTYLALGLLAAAVVALRVIRARFYPYGPCRWCQRRRGRGRGPGSGRGSWSHCPHCGGSGEQIRLGARIYRRWREQQREDQS